MPYAASRRLLFTVLLGCSCLHSVYAAEFLFAPTSLKAETPNDVHIQLVPQSTETESLLAETAALPVALPAALTATTLQALEQDLGAYAPTLATHYLQSARAEQAAGRHSAALELLAKAAHHERLQHGLDTPAQFPLLKMEVQSHLAQGNWLKAFARQEHLLLLQRRHYGDASIDTVATRAALGDLYFDAFRKVLLNRADAARLLPDYGAQSLFLKPEDLTRHQLAYLWLGHAQREYQTAIDTLLAHEAWSHPLLVDLEERLIQSLLLQAHERRVAIDPENFLRVQDSNLRDSLRFDEREHQYPFYRAGIAAHERIIAYRQAAAEPEPAALAEAMLALGDWHLLFGFTKAASRQYAHARRQLNAMDCDPKLVASILQPELPHQVSAFTGLQGDTTVTEFSGYVDVAFRISRGGRVRDIEVLGGTQNVDREIQRKLRRELQRAPFRPALDAEGSAMREQRVNLRYHFAQL